MIVSTPSSSPSSPSFTFLLFLFLSIPSPHLRIGYERIQNNRFSHPISPPSSKIHPVPCQSQTTTTHISQQTSTTPSLTPLASLTYPYRNQNAKPTITSYPYPTPILCHSYIASTPISHTHPSKPTHYRKAGISPSTESKVDGVEWLYRACLSRVLPYEALLIAPVQCHW